MTQNNVHPCGAASAAATPPSQPRKVAGATITPGSPFSVAERHVQQNARSAARWPWLVTIGVVLADQISKALWSSVILFDGGVGGSPSNVGAWSWLRPSVALTAGLAVVVIATAAGLVQRSANRTTRLGAALSLAGMASNALSLAGGARLTSPLDVGYGVPNLFALRLGFVAAGNVADLALWVGLILLLLGLVRENRTDILRLPSRRSVAAVLAAALAVGVWTSVWTGICAARVHRTGGYVAAAAVVR